MSSEFYIYKKEVDWSTLHEGFSIPVSIQILFQKQLKTFLKRGERKSINLVLKGKTYKAQIVNQLFDEKKYPRHKDIIQIRYSRRSNIARKLRLLFHHSYEYLKNERCKLPKNVHKQVRLPEESREFLVLYSTDLPNTLLLEGITNSDILEMKSYIFQEKIVEDDYELSLDYDKEDLSARIERKQQVIKVRKLDRAIGKSLKLLYDHKCQICGRNFGDKYEANIVEAHHIKPFVDSLNNDPENVMIICPNHHRVIHKVDPIFDRKRLFFEYPNGLEEALTLNRHL